jgi:hypothetical protein
MGQPSLPAQPNKHPIMDMPDNSAMNSCAWLKSTVNPAPTGDSPDRPAGCNSTTPHTKFDQNAPATLQEKLLKLGKSLAPLSKLI